MTHNVKKAARILKREGAPKLHIKNPERYLHAHKRRRLGAVTHTEVTSGLDRLFGKQ